MGNDTHICAVKDLCSYVLPDFHLLAIKVLPERLVMTINSFFVLAGLINPILLFHTTRSINIATIIHECVQDCFYFGMLLYIGLCLWYIHAGINCMSITLCKLDGERNTDVYITLSFL